MGTYYYLVCPVHKEECSAYRNSGGRLAGNEMLPIFLFRHSNCDLRVAPEWDRLHEGNSDAWEGKSWGELSEEGALPNENVSVLDVLTNEYERRYDAWKKEREKLIDGYYKMNRVIYDLSIRVSQLVERKPFAPTVVGETPTVVGETSTIVGETPKEVL